MFDLFCCYAKFLFVYILDNFICLILALTFVSAEIVYDHMRNLRTVYTKIYDLPTTGSGSVRLTKRQREIKNLCSFLRNYVSHKDGISNLDEPAEVCISFKYKWKCHPCCNSSKAIFYLQCVKFLNGFKENISINYWNNIKLYTRRLYETYFKLMKT